jgi:hypothetical protein
MSNNSSNFNDFYPFDPAAPIVMRNTDRNVHTRNYFYMEGRDPRSEALHAEAASDMIRQHKRVVEDREDIHGNRGDRLASIGYQINPDINGQNMYNRRYLEAMPVYFSNLGGRENKISVDPHFVFDEATLEAANRQSFAARIEAYEAFVNTEM